MIEKQVNKFYETKRAHENYENARFQEWLLRESTQATLDQELLIRNRSDGQFPTTRLLHSMDSFHMPKYILILQSPRLVFCRLMYTRKVVQGLGNYREASTHLFLEEI